MIQESVKPLKSRRWGRWVGGLLVLVTLCMILMFHSHRVKQREDAALARLREVADVLDVSSTQFPLNLVVPTRFQYLLPQRPYLILVAFRSGTRNPGQYLRDIPNRGPSELVFRDSDLTSEDLIRLGRLKHLEWLTMLNCQLAEGTLSDLKDSPDLKYLEVRKCQLSSKESINYARIPNLHFLCFTGSNAGDSVLEGLADHPRLTLLHLDGTSITDDGLRKIRRLPSLDKLHLGKTQVTGIGLAELDTPLTHLNLVGTRADDAAMTTIARLSSIQSLDLARTKVTVLGVRHLQQMPELRKLVLDRCNLGDQALEPLSAFPQPIRWSAIGTHMTRQNSID